MVEAVLIATVVARSELSEEGVVTKADSKILVVDCGASVVTKEVEVIVSVVNGIFVIGGKVVLSVVVKVTISVCSDAVVSSEVVKGVRTLVCTVVVGSFSSVFVLICTCENSVLASVVVGRISVFSVFDEVEVAFVANFNTLEFCGCTDISSIGINLKTAFIFSSPGFSVRICLVCKL